MIEAMITKAAPLNRAINVIRLRTLMFTFHTIYGKVRSYHKDERSACILPAGGMESRYKSVTTFGTTTMYTYTFEWVAWQISVSPVNPYFILRSNLW
jgi:hypothetical protein